MSQTQLTLRVPSHLHKALKLASVNQDRSIQDIAIEALTAQISGPKQSGLAAFFELCDRMRAEAEPGELDIEREEWMFRESNVFDADR